MLYLMEDMATGEIRLSILWEWLQGRTATATDESTGVQPGDLFTRVLFTERLLAGNTRSCWAQNRDVHDDSKTTTLPVASGDRRELRARSGEAPWYIDLLNATLGVHDLEEFHPTHRFAARRLRRGRRAHHA